MSYSPQTGKTILEKLREKSWNPYDSTNTRSIGSDGVIRNGPAEEFAIGNKYVLLPVAKNPRDPEQVMSKLEKLSVKIGRETPTIMVRGERMGWTGFRIGAQDIKVINEMGQIVPYEEFLRCLETIVDARTGIYPAD
ncbi:MAG: hypothetical protein AABW73_03250 [Nanoarchaeota archaeon]